MFGLHFNAEISSQIQDNLELLDSIRILNHDLVDSAEAKSTDEIVLNKTKFAREKLPKPLESDKKISKCGFQNTAVVHQVEIKPKIIIQ